MDAHHIITSDREFEPYHDDTSNFYLLENSCTLIIVTSFDDVFQEFQKLTETIEQNMNDKNRIIDDIKNAELVLLIPTNVVYSIILVKCHWIL